MPLNTVELCMHRAPLTVSGYSMKAAFQAELIACPVVTRHRDTRCMPAWLRPPLICTVTARNPVLRPSTPQISHRPDPSPRDTVDCAGAWFPWSNCAPVDDVLADLLAGVDERGAHLPPVLGQLAARHRVRLLKSRHAMSAQIMRKIQNAVDTKRLPLAWTLNDGRHGWFGDHGCI